MASSTEVHADDTKAAASEAGYSAEVKVTAERQVKPIVVSGTTQLIATAPHDSVLENLNVRLRDIELEVSAQKQGSNPSG